jgi:hypothetical protein
VNVKQLNNFKSNDYKKEFKRNIQNSDLNAILRGYQEVVKFWQRGQPNPDL